VKMTRLSCHLLRSNAVRLRLSLIGDNLGNLWRRLVLPKKIEKGPLTRLQQWFVRTGTAAVVREDDVPDRGHKWCHASAAQRQPWQREYFITHPWIGAEKGDSN